MSRGPAPNLGALAMATQLGQDWHADRQHAGTYGECRKFFCRTVKGIVRWSQRTQARRGFDASGRTRRRR